ncbi:ribose transport system ATP-binding protein [Mesorhizobium albiziae]|uniref:Ribose transport system ATP-binding protein n=1 Tax=Neomesorhizobium albiziae TaxID=335020 RepID=A0A1I4DRL2_9HYPH|nr:D-ribose transporter ATP-binding protein [Mesorhizobium albiziae]SFK94686.1 ribose transport system ATP-binding protein [Mesorhizobium albiziae]
MRLSDIRKVYPGVVALAGFELQVRPGEVIGIVGENGAGKSTLMKVLGGVITPDGGTIEVDGVATQSFTVTESIRAGIAFVHQELNLFDNLDVAANVFIGREPRKYGLFNIVDTERQRAAVAPILRRLGANFSPQEPVRNLSLAQQQIVEIAKALSCDARLIILDEPTSSLPLHETEKLLEVIRGLKADGIAVIFISHRLHEIERACDRVVVLRDGKFVGELDRAEVTYQKLVRMMIGRELKVVYTPPSAPRGEVALSARDIRTAAYPQQPVTLDLHRGEILGLAGLVGSGRSELARAIFGIDPVFGGTVAFAGKEFPIKTTGDATARGIFLVPEDRKGAGILLDMSIAQNITLPDLWSYSRGGIVSAAAESKRGERSKADLDIRAPSVKVRTGALSGGNQQKVVLAKWLAMNPQVIIADEPTRGIDVGAKFEIYRLMRGLADAGVAVLMISSDMEEVIGVSDRIAVMHEGRISGMLTRDQFSEENVLMLAVGGEGNKTGVSA